MNYIEEKNIQIAEIKKQIQQINKEKYGIEAQNKALESVRKKEKDFKEELRANVDIK